MNFHSLIFFCSFALLSWTVPPDAQAQSPDANQAAVARGLEILQTGDIEAARNAFQTALETPGNSPETLVQIHMYLGFFAAAFGEDTVAQAHWGTALAIDGSAVPPPEVSAPMRRQIDQLRASTQTIMAEITSAGTADPTATTPLALSVRNVPEGAAARARIRALGESTWEASLDLPVSTFQLPSSAWNATSELSLALDVLDTHGGVMHTSSALQLFGSGSDGDVASDTSSVWASPWLWTVVGIIVAGGVAAAIAVDQTATTEYQFSEPTFAISGN